MLELSNVSKKYKHHVAVKDVSFTIEDRSILGLIGPNGAGKTTLIRMINQIIKPDTGFVRFRGRDMIFGDVKKIGYLPEDRGLYGKMTVLENLSFLGQLKGISRKNIDKKIFWWGDRLQIAESMHKKVDELSKGMKQKVQFIGGVLHDPELIIMDEPFSGFDPATAELITNEILNLNKNGATIMLSTHRMENVEELCTNVVLINKAEKIIDGSVNTIREKFKDNTYQICYKGNPLPPELTDGLIIRRDIVSSGWLYEIKIKEEAHLQKIQSYVTSSGGIIYKIIEKIPSIKEIYLSELKKSA